MKKIMILAAATALCACGGNQKYAIQGDIEGLSGTLYLYDRDQAVDSVTVENGSFLFEGTVEQPAVRYLTNASGSTPATFRAMVILEPGTITVADDAENPGAKKVSGTPANDAYTAYTAQSSALIKEFRDPETSDERREAIEEEYGQLGTNAMEANRDNYFGVMMLQQQVYELSGQELLDQIALFTPAMQQTELLAKIRETAEQKIRTDVGQPYIDVEQPDADGNVVSLKSVVENPSVKYVLLDFWASWCGPCMGEVPHLKKTYEAFHDKGFEIYGVSFDKDREKWLAAVEKNGMDWVHVSEINGFDCQAGKDYAVQAIPTNLLIDAEGKIVAKNLRGEALYEKIAELLGE
ncbi:MAG: AhpC/TSA family protein [Alistipes sp.]|nr:AhpC/TSA family protein [Alistipes sp.]